jgi:hypothetical protein
MGVGKKVNTHTFKRKYATIQNGKYLYQKINFLVHAVWHEAIEHMGVGKKVNNHTFKRKNMQQFKMENIYTRR